MTLTTLPPASQLRTGRSEMNLTEMPAHVWHKIGVAGYVRAYGEEEAAVAKGSRWKRCLCVVPCLLLEYSWGNEYHNKRPFARSLISPAMRRKCLISSVQGCM